MVKNVNEVNRIEYILYNIYIYIWLVVSTPLKNISRLGLLFPIYGKNMFQTTNHIYIYA